MTLNEEIRELHLKIQNFPKPNTLKEVNEFQLLINKQTELARLFEEQKNNEQ